MHYKREAAADQARDFRAWLREFERIRARGNAAVVIGLGAYLNDLPETRAQEADALKADLDGVAHFSYRAPDRARAR